MTGAATAATTVKGQVELIAAARSDCHRIEAMMQFYNDDLSEWVPITLSDSGFYALRPKSDYWDRPGVRPFLIRVDGDWAGFAIVDDEAVHEETEFNMGYFFVGRRYRGLRVGRAVAALLFRRFAGRWEVGPLAANLAAVKFWERVLSEPPCHGVAASDLLTEGEAYRVLRFSTCPARS